MDFSPKLEPCILRWQHFLRNPPLYGSWKPKIFGQWRRRNDCHFLFCPAVLNRTKSDNLPTRILENLGILANSLQLEGLHTLVVVKDQYSHWIMKEKKPPLLHNFVCFLMHNKKLQLRSSFIIGVRNYLFLKNYVTTERAISHKVSYYKQLSIACHQISYCGNNCFE